MSELVKRLVQIQSEKGLTDTAFAATLGVHRVMWSLTRRGKRQPGKRTIEGAFRQWPELSYVYAQSLQISTGSRVNPDEPKEAVAS